MKKIIYTLILFLVTFQINADDLLGISNNPITFAEESIKSTVAMNPQDPFENYNRAIFDFNLDFNDVIGEPIANTYNKLPSVARKGVSNFFQNLGEPLNVVNLLLQGKIELALGSFMRFSINSTLGLFGLIDIAKEAGINYQKEDLGQTFYIWGLWQESSFIMMPFVGPYTTRELLGVSIDSTYNPIYPHIIKTDDQGKILMFVGDKFIDYSKVVHLSSVIKKQPDPYIFMRESYLQYRINLIYDGNPPEVAMDDFDFE